MNDASVAPFERHTLERAVYRRLVCLTGIQPSPPYLSRMAECIAMRLLDDTDPDAPILVPADLDDAYLAFVRHQWLNDAAIGPLIRSQDSWPRSLDGVAAWSCAVVTAPYARSPRFEREAWTRVIRAATRLMAERGIPTWEAFYANEAAVDELTRETTDLDVYVARSVELVQNLQRSMIVMTDAILTMVNLGWHVPLRRFPMDFSQADARSLLGQETLEVSMEQIEAVVAVARTNAVTIVARVYGEASLATVGGRLTREAFLLPAS